MTATITINEAGQISFPEAVSRVFGLKPGERVQAEVTPDKIEIVREAPEVSEGEMENGVLVLPKLGISMNAGAAVRAERDELANRAARR
ncbi:MAG: AbrB/MazE/SpoVT family DNA-binding domain-containing protein [Verrucomicrobiaceae bacterium]